MRSKFIALIAGILLFLSIVVTFVWILPTKAPDKSEINYDTAISKIRNNEIAEATIRQDSLELTNKDKEKFVTKLDSSDATRTVLLGAIEEVNKEKPGSIKTTLEQSSSGWGWIVLINNAAFFVMWALTLAVIVYAVRTLSRNKG